MYPTFFHGSYRTIRSISASWIYDESGWWNLYCIKTSGWNFQLTWQLISDLRTTPIKQHACRGWMKHATGVIDTLDTEVLFRCKSSQKKRLQTTTNASAFPTCLNREICHMSDKFEWKSCWWGKSHAALPFFSIQNGSLPRLLFFSFSFFKKGLVGIFVCVMSKFGIKQRQLLKGQSITWSFAFCVTCSLTLHPIHYYSLC